MARSTNSASMRPGCSSASRRPGAGSRSSASATVPNCRSRSTSATRRRRRWRWSRRCRSRAWWRRHRRVRRRRRPVGRADRSGGLRRALDHVQQRFLHQRRRDRLDQIVADAVVDQVAEQPDIVTVADRDHRHARLAHLGQLVHRGERQIDTGEVDHQQARRALLAQKTGRLADAALVDRGIGDRELRRPPGRRPSCGIVLNEGAEMPLFLGAGAVSRPWRREFDHWTMSASSCRPCRSGSGRSPRPRAWRRRASVRRGSEIAGSATISPRLNALAQPRLLSGRLQRIIARIARPVRAAGQDHLVRPDHHLDPPVACPCARRVPVRGPALPIGRRVAIRSRTPVAAAVRPPPSHVARTARIMEVRRHGCRHVRERARSGVRRRAGSPRSRCRSARCRNASNRPVRREVDRMLKRPPAPVRAAAARGGRRRLHGAQAGNAAAERAGADAARHRMDGGCRGMASFLNRA